MTPTHSQTNTHTPFGHTPHLLSDDRRHLSCFCVKIDRDKLPLRQIKHTKFKVRMAMPTKHTTSRPHRAMQRLSPGRARDNPVMDIVPNKALSLPPSLSLSLHHSLRKQSESSFSRAKARAHGRTGARASARMGERAHTHNKHTKPACARTHTRNTHIGNTD